MADSNRKETAVVVGAYLVTLGAIVFASVSPVREMWAFSAGSFIENGWILTALAGVFWLLLARWLMARLMATDSSAWRWWPFAGAFGVTLTIFMVVFRTQAHFLGDGYEMLSTFAAEHPIVKTRALGEATLHLWMRDLFGGANRDASMISFRVLSIGAGVLYLGTLVFGSWKLFASARQRLLLVLGMGMPGYLLLSFGYVELYSLLVASVALFAVVGMLAAKGLLSRWWIVPAMVPPLVLHVMGIIVVPAAIYLLCAGTPLGDRVKAMSTTAKLTSVLLLAVIGGWAFWYYQGESYFFRLAVLPLVVDRFTLDGYTLFSVRHLIDMGNLVLVLLPGALVMAATILITRDHRAAEGRMSRFLVVLALSQWGAVFLFDPKLGMPRDWDLFAFAGVSVAALGTYWLVRLARDHKAATLAVLLTAGLHALVLAGRVAVVNRPEVAAEQFRTHMQWDLKRHQTSWTILVTFYQDTGDSARAQSEFAHWLGVFPGYQRNREGLALLNAGRLDEALREFREVVRDNPSFVPAYGNMGTAFFRMNQIDSAEVYLQIARGMNPYNPVVLASQGQLLWSRSDAAGAVAAWRQALAVDSTQMQAAMGLATYYRQVRDRDNYFRYLAVAAAGGGAPPPVLVELGEYFLSIGQTERGRDYLRQAETAGLDPSAVNALRRRHGDFAL